MKKTAWLLCLLLLLSGCKTAPSAPATEPSETQAIQTQAPAEFTQEDLDGTTRYSGGGICIEMEGGFSLVNSSEGYLCYSNDVMDVIISATDDYDAQVLAAYGYDIATLSLEDYGCIIIDSNQLPQDCMFYDSRDNLCLSYTGSDTQGGEYAVRAVVKKDERTGTFWLIQFVGKPAVIEAYAPFLPQWAASVAFT